MALLDILCSGTTQCHLIRCRHVVEIGVLEQRIQRIVTHRPVRVCQHRLGEVPIVEITQGAITPRQIQLT